MKRVTILCSSLLVASLVLAAPVLAAAPANDVWSGRQIVSVGFSDTVDTTAAGTDTMDAEMNPPECGAPATDASVWYEVTAAADGFVVVDVSGSNYAAGLIVATGAPGSFSFQTCGPGAVVFEATAGETYTILAFDDQLDGTGNGGRLAIQIVNSPPPPEIALTVDRSGKFNSKTGSATISGTVTCTNGPAEFSEIDVFVRQVVGRFYIDGGGFIEGFACDGVAQRWSVEVFGANGTFRGGKALTVSFAFACGQFLCGEGFAERVVQLKGR